VNNAGTFKKTGSATTSTISTLLNNAGTVDVENGTLNLTGGGDNNGTLKVNANVNINIQGVYSGSGFVELSGASARAEIGTHVENDLVFDPGASATALFDSAANFSNIIHDSTGQSNLDLADILFNSNTSFHFTSNTTGGMLAISDGVRTANLNLVGSYTASDFTISNDGRGGTLLKSLARSHKGHTAPKISNSIPHAVEIPGLVCSYATTFGLKL